MQNVKKRVNIRFYNVPWTIYCTSIEFMQYGKDLSFEIIY